MLLTFRIGFALNFFFLCCRSPNLNPQLVYHSYNENCYNHCGLTTCKIMHGLIVVDPSQLEGSEPSVLC